MQRRMIPTPSPLSETSEVAFLEAAAVGVAVVNIMHAVLERKKS